MAERKEHCQANSRCKFESVSKHLMTT